MRVSPANANIVELDRFETSKGNPIHNSQDLSALTPAEIRTRLDSFRRRFPSASPRNTRPTGIYNCHGRVFAASRTGIYETAALRLILRDDGYRRVLAHQTQPGDIVLYVDESGDIEHSAILITPARNNLTQLDQVVSKWGNFLEYVHELPICPYDYAAIEFWRIDSN